MPVVQYTKTTSGWEASLELNHADPWGDGYFEFNGPTKADALSGLAAQIQRTRGMASRKLREAMIVGDRIDQYLREGGAEELRGEAACPTTI